MKGKRGIFATKRHEIPYLLYNGDN